MIEFTCKDCGKPGSLEKRPHEHWQQNGWHIHWDGDDVKSAKCRPCLQVWGDAEWEKMSAKCHLKPWKTPVGIGSPAVTQWHRDMEASQFQDRFVRTANNV